MAGGRKISKFHLGSTDHVIINHVYVAFKVAHTMKTFIGCAKLGKK